MMSAYVWVKVCVFCVYGRIGYYKKATHMQCMYTVLAKPLQSTD